jgi:hypothetical protein
MRPSWEGRTMVNLLLQNCRPRPLAFAPFPGSVFEAGAALFSGAGGVNGMPKTPMTPEHKEVQR